MKNALPSRLATAATVSAMISLSGCATPTPAPGPATAASPATGAMSAPSPAAGAMSAPSPAAGVTSAPSPPVGAMAASSAANVPQPQGSASAAATASQGAAAATATGSVDSLVGQPAPDFTATGQDGTEFHLAAQKGKSVVVYFYPKDETPGCTHEACSFRDSWQAIAKTGATLVGISGDSRKSHQAFASHYHLPFILLSDPDGAIARRYGVPFAGVHKRQTVIVGPDGNVRDVYRTVDVSTHAAQILAALTHAG